MKSDDKRVIWKKKSDLQLMQIILEFIEKHQVHSVREYQQKLKEYPKEVPSVWFIKERFGSWDKLLIQLGETRFERYCWSKMTDEEIKLVASEFIKNESILSQREYEKRTVGNKSVPSLDTLKKRFDDLKPLFKNRKEDTISDFQLLFELRKEIVRLEMETSLSMTEFRKKSNSEKLPSVDTIMRRTGKSWEDLMEEIGFDYRTIKVKKLTINLM
ncbi:hypothetical protein KUA55_02845 [Enterococcus sp. ALS3]|uniref:Uncharacterized protein n=1 Tax=Enterococcus alishanensis TaxID=1303817 RepID=A0ABS6T9M7_9ENTE|nr:hypothetical protein [Enterococcus alishanensis]MBV7389601.1 hypothetical protein [Enterococcus alishanensis]